MEKYNYNLGKLGEKIAEKYLIKNKYNLFFCLMLILIL